MSLIPEFKRMLAELREQESATTARVERNTAEIERLMAENAADQATRTALLNDIDYLERQLAHLTEHTELVEEPVEPERQPSQDTRTEVDELLRARREAERQQQQSRRRKSKPDPVKAARKAAKAMEQERAGHFAKDPLKVHARDKSPRVDRTGSGKGTKRVRLTEGLPPESKRLRYEHPTPTQDERAKLVLEILLENDAMSQSAIADEVAALMDCSRATAQPIVSESLAFLKYRKQILYTGQKAPSQPGGRADSPVWKATATATPHERAAAGLPVDIDNYAGTTTRPPQRVSPDQRISIESSQFEGKR